MDVYLTNNLTGRGLWVSLPQSRTALLDTLDKNYITQDGEYQMTALRLGYLPEQECTGNLFLLNQKVRNFDRLPMWQKERLLQIAFNEGISIETALFQYL